MAARVSTQSLDNNLLVQAQQGRRALELAAGCDCQARLPEHLWLLGEKMVYSWIPTKNYYQGITNETMAVIRLAEVYMMQAEAWNEYLDAPDEEHVYKPLNKVRVRAGIPTVEDA